MSHWALELAEIKIEHIKDRLYDLDSVKALPSAQIKDIERTLDRMLLKAKLAQEKKARREKLMEEGVV